MGFGFADPAFFPLKMWKKSNCPKFKFLVQGRGKSEEGKDYLTFHLLLSLNLDKGQYVYKTGAFTSYYLVTKVGQEWDN